MIVLELGHDEARAIHGALLHTRREYLDMREREIINVVINDLNYLERPPSVQVLRAFARRNKQRTEATKTTTTTTVTSYSR